MLFDCIFFPCERVIILVYISDFVLLFVSQRKRKQSTQDEDAVSLCSLDISVSTVLPTSPAMGTPLISECVLLTCWHGL